MIGIDPVGGGRVTQPRAPGSGPGRSGSCRAISASANWLWVRVIRQLAAGHDAGHHVAEPGQHHLHQAAAERGVADDQQPSGHDGAAAQCPSAQFSPNARSYIPDVSRNGLDRQGKSVQPPLRSTLATRRQPRIVEHQRLVQHHRAALAQPGQRGEQERRRVLTRRRLAPAPRRSRPQSTPRAAPCASASSAGGGLAITMPGRPAERRLGPEPGPRASRPRRRAGTGRPLSRA